MKYLLLIIIALSLSVQAEDASKPTSVSNAEKLIVNPPIPQQRLFDQDLTRYKSASEVAWLGDKDNRFLTLWSEQTTAKVIGTSWLFSDTDTSANNPNIIQALRYALNDKGFNTYSISPFSKYIQPSYVEEQLLAQLQVLSDKLENSKSKRLLITQGNNSSIITDILIKNPTIKLDAIVILSAHSDTPEKMKQLAKNMTAIKIPVLDLYQKADGDNVHSYVKERAVVMKRSRKRSYRQTEIIGLPTQTATQSATSQAIYGWLKSLGWYL